MKAATAFLVLLLWIATLGGAYWLGQRQERLGGSLTRMAGAVQAEPALPPPAVPETQAATAAEGAPAGASRPSVEKIMSQFKALMRQGGLQNPLIGLKAMTLLAQIPPEDIPKALELAREVEEVQQRMLLHMVLLSRWAESDGPAALAYAEEHLDGGAPMMEMVKMGVISSWAQSDPEAAWKWFQTDRSEESGGLLGGRSMPVMGLFSAMGSRDLDQALGRAQELDSPEERRMALAGIFQSASDDESRQKLLKAVDALPDAGERQQARQMIVSQWAMMEPQKALEYAGTLSPDERRQVSRSLTPALMMMNPREGAAKLMELADDSTRGETYEQVVSVWVNTDPNAAGQWLGEQPQTPELDGARASFARQVAGRDPYSAFEWAKTVSEPERRSRVMRDVYSSWKKQDAAAAEQALENSGLPPAKVEEIRGATKTP